MSEIKTGDILQITDEAHHWFPALVIVEEPRPWGAHAYMIMVTSNDPDIPNDPAYIRLKKGEFKRVGTAVITL